MTDRNKSWIKQCVFAKLRRRSMTNQRAIAVIEQILMSTQAGVYDVQLEEVIQALQLAKEALVGVELLPMVFDAFEAHAKAFEMATNEVEKLMSQQEGWT